MARFILTDGVLGLGLSAGVGYEVLMYIMGTSRDWLSVVTSIAFYMLVGAFAGRGFWEAKEARYRSVLEKERSEAQLPSQ